MSKFFPNGPTGSETLVYRAFRGYWVGSDRDCGYGMQLPSDLVSVEEAGYQHSIRWGLWRSQALRKFYAISYDAHQLQWFGFRLRAKTVAQARLEFADSLAEDE